MDHNSCYHAGYVTKKHGLKGEIKIHLESEFPHVKLESIFVEQDNRLIPFFVENISLQAGTGIFKLEEIDTPEQARPLLNKKVYLPKSIQPKTKNESPEDDIEGFEIVCNNEVIGVVWGINNFTLNPMIMAIRGGKNLLIPFNDHFIKEVKTEEKKIFVDLPEGFLDI